MVARSLTHAPSGLGRLEQDERARKGKLSPGESVTAPGIPSGSVPWSPSGGEGITSRAGFGRTGTRFRG